MSLLRLPSVPPAQARLALQVSAGLAVALAAKTCWDLLRILRVAHSTFGKDERLPLRPRPSRKERDEALKRGPKALQPFLAEGLRPDAIVIGSGIGGLTNAVILGRAGWRVLVLEQHDVAGGCLHSYAAGGYEWDVGIHYVGEVGGPGLHKALLEQLTRGQLEWKAQEGPYDVAYVPRTLEEGLACKWDLFPHGKGIDANEAMLCERFPAEAAAIRAFFQDVRRQTMGALFILPKILPRWLASALCPLLDVFTSFYARLSTSTAEALSRLGVKDPQVRTCLTYCWGDLGNPPASLSYGIQLGLHAHFMKDGGFFPVGGASSISHALVETIRAQGGDVLVRCPVSRILMDGGRACGVALANGKEVRLAPRGQVVSAVSLATLYRTLLPPEALGSQGPPPCVQPGGYMKEGWAAMSLFVGLENAGAELGLDAIQANAWAFRGPNHDELFETYLSQTTAEVVAGKVPMPGVFVGFPSSKDPAWEEDFPGKSSVTIVAFTNYAWFAPHEGGRVHKRGAEYDALKDAIAKEMWAFACDVYPQLRKAKIGHFEAGTPLSNNYYIGSQRGEIYGADHSHKRFALRNLMETRPDVAGIPGLVVGAQDVLCGGFAGALIGGVLCAGEMMGSPIGIWAGALLSGFRFVPGFRP